MLEIQRRMRSSRSSSRSSSSSRCSSARRRLRFRLLPLFLCVPSLPVPVPVQVVTAFSVVPTSSAFIGTQLFPPDQRRTNTNHRHHYPTSVCLSLTAMGGLGNLLTAETATTDRFQAVCFVDPAAQHTMLDAFDPALVVDTENHNHNSKEVWVAVYRSNNNQPSVLVREEFFRAMQDATNDATTAEDTEETTEHTTQNVATVSPSMTNTAASFLQDTIPSLLEVPQMTPVAVARLVPQSPSGETDSTPPTYVLDQLRCSLKKETMDVQCDGGSEFLEALSCAVDTLVLRHLQHLLLTEEEEAQKDSSGNNNVVFEGTLRTKASLFNAKLFEHRGFCPVDTLAHDMATHVSNYEACLASYAERAIGHLPSTTSTNNSTTEDTMNPEGLSSSSSSLSQGGSGQGFGSTNENEENAKEGTAVPRNNTNKRMSTGTRDRALQIVALLGRLDPDVQRNVQQEQKQQASTNSFGQNDADEDDYDPWANINLGLQR